jgi:phosphosulfolactate synthase (CoM biosynthesis protein A)
VAFGQNINLINSYYNEIAGITTMLLELRKETFPEILSDQH